MTHEFLSIGQDSSPFEALPGIRTVNGTGFNPSFLQQMFGYTAENSTNIGPWFPFERGIQVPTPSYWDNGTSPQWGLYYWVQNQILQLNGTTNNWTDILTISNQQDINDYSIHTGLYEVYGTDGKLYGCGMYPGSTSNSHVGAVKFDVATETWSDSGEFNLGSTSRFSNCHYCIPWRGKLWLLTENKLYGYDPVADNITLEFPSVGSASSPNQKIFIMGQRFFIAVTVSSRLKIFERVGGLWAEMADLGQITMSADGMIDYAQTNTQVIFFFNSVETIGGTPMSGYRAVEVTTFDPQIGGTLVTDEVTTPVLSGFGQVFSDALNTYPDVRFFTSADSSAVPSQFPQINVYVQEDLTNQYGIAWQTFRWVDKASQLASLGAASGGGVSYVSSKSGAGGIIFSAPILPTTQRKVVVHQVEADEESVESGILVSYWAFGTTATAQVRIWCAQAVSPVSSPIRSFRGTIWSVVSGGTLFNFTQINNVPVSTTGGGSHQFVWYRSNDGWSPWLNFSLTVELSD